MARRARTAVLLAGSLMLGPGTACKGPAVPHPLTHDTRYLCCNLHYEKPKIADVNFQQGTLVPFGTRVTITSVRGNDVTFQAPGQPPLTVVLKYGRRTLDMDTFVHRLFVEQDPKAKLACVSKKIREAIEAGTVEPGMTRDQVLMSLGYPPAHRTPSLDSPQWIYWQNRWQTFVVGFDHDRVDRVQR